MQITKKCEVCVTNNRKSARGHRFVETLKKLKIVGLGIMRKREDVYILARIDYYTRVMKLHILKDGTTEEVKVEIGRLTMTHNTLEKIITDNPEMEEYMIKKEKEHGKASIEAYTSNRKVERAISMV